jgi:hypothetical protein
MSMQTQKEHGVFSWNELATTDMAAAKKFYKDALGWNLRDMDNPAMPYSIAMKGEREVAGILGITKDMKGMSPQWGSYVTVDDVDARVRKVQALGGKLCVPPKDIPNVGRFAVIADPQGAMLGMITYLNKE